MKKQSPPIPCTHPAPVALPIALAVPGLAGGEWRVPICPRCGRSHDHAPQEGLALSHCFTHPDRALTERKGEYVVVLATEVQARELKRIMRDRRGPWEIVNRHGAPLSRHRRLTCAMEALTRWRRADRWASLRNRRIDALAGLLAGEQGGIGGSNLWGPAS